MFLYDDDGSIDFLRNLLWMQKSMIFLQIFGSKEEAYPRGRLRTENENLPKNMGFCAE